MAKSKAPARPIQRIEQTLKIFKVIVPDEDETKPDRTYYFTTEEHPVTYAGQQYVPVSYFDAARWALGT